MLCDLAVPMFDILGDSEGTPEPSEVAAEFHWSAWRHG